MSKKLTGKDRRLLRSIMKFKEVQKQYQAFTYNDELPPKVRRAYESIVKQAKNLEGTE